MKFGAARHELYAEVMNRPALGLKCAYSLKIYFGEQHKAVGLFSGDPVEEEGTVLQVHGSQVNTGSGIRQIDLHESFVFRCVGPDPYSGDGVNGYRFNGSGSLNIDQLIGRIREYPYVPNCSLARKRDGQWISFFHDDLPDHPEILVRVTVVIIGSGDGKNEGIDPTGAYIISE